MKQAAAILALFLSAIFAFASDNDFELKLIPISKGIAQDKRSDEAEIIGMAREAGVDLLRNTNPYLASSFRHGQLFYVFYKEVLPDSSPQNYLIQRVHKVERFFRSPEDGHPLVKESYLVEAFKLRAGRMKKADMHQGTFNLGRYHRREILKEYEIGFAEIPGVAEGNRWPFDDGYLYWEIQDYRPDRRLYDDVIFTESRKWTLSVAFDEDGKYSIRSPEFGFDAPDVMPTSERKVQAEPEAEREPEREPPAEPQKEKIPASEESEPAIY